MPPSDRMATSVVPPPISTTIEPVGSVTGRPAPIAAAIGSSISQTLRAPALSADRLDVARRAAQHHLGLFTDGKNLPLAALSGQRHDRWFVENDAATLHIDQRVGRAEVDPHVCRKEPD